MFDPHFKVKSRSISNIWEDFSVLTSESLIYFGCAIVGFEIIFSGLYITSTITCHSFSVYVKLIGFNYLVCSESGGNPCLFILHTSSFHISQAECFFLPQASLFLIVRWWNWAEVLCVLKPVPYSLWSVYHQGWWSTLWVLEFFSVCLWWQWHRTYVTINVTVFVTLVPRSYFFMTMYLCRQPVIRVSLFPFIYK